MMGYNQISGQRTNRIEAVSDGVFSIAMTLLVFNIKVPTVPAIHSEKALMDSFLDLTPQWLSYFLSFMTLGIYWAAHATQFHYILKSDRNLTWITLFFLLFVSMIPFTTAFLSQYISFRFSIGIYWFNLGMLGLLLGVHWRYAKKHKFLSIEGDAAKEIDGRIKRRVIEAQSLYTAGALLCFISTWLSIVTLILIQLNYALALFSGSRNSRITQN